MAEELPASRDLRWPILVTLDRMAEGESIHDLLIQVERLLDLSGERALDPDTGRPLLTDRIRQAIADLLAAGALGAEESGRLQITSSGRLLTEREVLELPEVPVEPASASASDKPTLGNYVWATIRAFLETPGP